MVLTICVSIVPDAKFFYISKKRVLESTIASLSIKSVAILPLVKVLTGKLIIRLPNDIHTFSPKARKLQGWW